MIVKIGVTAIFLQGLFKYENKRRIKYRITIKSIIKVKKIF